MQWYSKGEKLTKVLVDEWGFTLNEYDKCVANKQINGEQCTIVWHVDDLKISHKDIKVVEQMVKDMDEKFGQHKPITAKYGPIVEYLGMTLDFSSPKQFKIRMDEYLKKMFQEDVSEFFSGEAPTPAANNLFRVRDNGVDRLCTEQAEEFHTLTAKLLFVSMRARPDILTAVSFLCTRVSKPDVDDRYKLRRVLQYLRSTPDLHLTLECSNLADLCWHVDASYAVHPDLKSHSGGVFIMGKGAVISGSSKQKINTKSSTEAELVGVDDFMGRVLSTRYFIEAQGYNVGPTTIYQDNKSAILLENNGMASSTKRTKHINVRYFFVTDRVEKGEVTIDYCSTDKMIADFFTKPLQGRLFQQMRAWILNMKYVDPTEE